MRLWARTEAVQTWHKHGFRVPQTDRPTGTQAWPICAVIVRLSERVGLRAGARMEFDSQDVTVIRAWAGGGLLKK